MNRSVGITSLLLAIILLLAACGQTVVEPEAAVPDAVVQATAVPAAVEPDAGSGGATPAAEATSVAEPAATEVPPTSTPEPTETQVPPTAEPAPTATVKPTTEPPPVVSPETILGMFTQFDVQAEGNNWLLFNEDSTWVARHGPTFDAGVPVAEGTFLLEGDVLTLLIPEGCPEGERYQLRFASASQLHFEGVDSTCDYFVDDFKRQPNWKRAEP